MFLSSMVALPLPAICINKDSISVLYLPSAFATCETEGNLPRLKRANEIVAISFWSFGTFAI